MSRINLPPQHCSASQLDSLNKLARSISCALCDSVVVAPADIQCGCGPFCLDCIKKCAGVKWDCPTCGMSFVPFSGKGRAIQTNTTVEAIKDVFLKVCGALERAPVDWWKVGGRDLTGSTKEEEGGEGEGEGEGQGGEDHAADDDEDDGRDGTEQDGSADLEQDDDAPIPFSPLPGSSRAPLLPALGSSSLLPPPPAEGAARSSKAAAALSSSSSSSSVASPHSGPVVLLPSGLSSDEWRDVLHLASRGDISLLPSESPEAEALEPAIGKKGGKEHERGRERLRCSDPFKDATHCIVGGDSKGKDAFRQIYAKAKGLPLLDGRWATELREKGGGKEEAERSVTGKGKGSANIFEGYTFLLYGTFPEPSSRTPVPPDVLTRARLVTLINQCGSTEVYPMSSFTKKTAPSPDRTIVLLCCEPSSQDVAGANDSADELFDDIDKQDLELLDAKWVIDSASQGVFVRNLKMYNVKTT